jgi:hypothetical protein
VPLRDRPPGRAAGIVIEHLTLRAPIGSQRSSLSRYQPTRFGSSRRGTT